MENSYTEVTEGVVQCNDCGAHADTKENVSHYDSCNPGESKKWEDFYNEENYTDAIRLSLNGFIDDMEIHEFGYSEEYDVWIIDATDHEWGRIQNITIYGSVVRGCHKAVKQGIKSWT